MICKEYDSQKVSIKVNHGYQLCSRESAMPLLLSKPANLALKVSILKNFYEIKFPFWSAITYGVILTSVCYFVKTARHLMLSSIQVTKLGYFLVR